MQNWLNWYVYTIKSLYPPNPDLIMSIGKPELELQRIETQFEIDMLMQSHQDWLKNPASGKQLNLSNKDVTGYIFEDYDLSKAIFQGCKLSYCYLNKIKLHGANLMGCNLSNAKLDFVEGNNLTVFSTSDFTSIEMNNCTFLGSKFNNIINNSSMDLSQVKFENATFRTTNFIGKFQNVSFTSDTVFSADNIRGKLTTVEFSKCSFTSQNITECELINCYFTQSTINITEAKSVNFANSHFIQNKEFNGKFIKCNFNKTKLSANPDINPKVSTIFNVKFDDCELNETNFSNSLSPVLFDVYNCRINDAFLNDSKFSGEFKIIDSIANRINMTRVLDTEKAALVNNSFIGAIFSQSEFPKADFSRCNLNGADFTYANLTQSNLSYPVNSDSVQFGGANLSSAIYFDGIHCEANSKGVCKR